VNYEGLEKTYWDQQQQRVQELLRKINARPEPLQGRAVPDDESLAIGEGRRLALAVVFLDISSFSQRPSTTIEEQDMALRVVNLFFTEMMKIAEDYGGTVEKNTGDGLMAYFEDVGHMDNGAKRAVAAALTMMAANHYLIRPILKATPTKEIEFRISIDRGDVTIARLGAAKRFNANVAIGSTPNFAAKMLSKAGPGEIVIGASARYQLPWAWQANYTELITTETGWVHIGSGLPYGLYRYTGRWARTV
jgi:adenylate cyclase